jgi:hypothetical protein
MIRWRIWYEGGATFSDLDGIAFDAPARGVQAIAQAEPSVGRQINAHRDFYWWRPEKGQWFGGDIFGLWDYLVEPGPKKVIFGRSVKNEEYDAVIKRVLADPDLPAKTARLPEEVY